MQSLIEIRMNNNPQFKAEISGAKTMSEAQEIHNKYFNPLS